MTQLLLRTDGVHCRESAGTGAAVVLKVVPVTGVTFSGVTMDQFLCASFFPHPLLVCNNDVCMVITYNNNSRLGTTGMIVNPARGQLNIQ